MDRRIAIILMLGALILAGCGGKEEDARRGGLLNLVATTGQVGDLVRSVGGDRVKVEVLMGPGIDPHLYKASAGDVERLRRADAIFLNGLHLEAKMAEVLVSMASSRPVLAVGEALPESRLISPPGYTGIHDPHVWFDLELWSHGAERVAEMLAQMDPSHREEYLARAQSTRDEILGMHDYAQRQFARIPEAQRVLITAHDAFSYLGRAYGLEVRGLQGISTASEAGTRDVQDLAAFIAERRIPAIFVESSVSPRAIQAVHEAVLARGFELEVGGEIYSDALGDAGSPEGTYLGMVRHNVDTITAALLGEAGHADR